MSQNVQYMNYLDYLIRVENQQLITDKLKVNNIIANNTDINIEGNIKSNNDIDCNNLNATNSINIKNNNTTKFTIDSNGNITSNNITSSGNISSTGINISKNSTNYLSTDSNGNIKIKGLTFNSNNPNYILTSSTQSTNDNEDKIITTKKYVEDNYINKSSGDLVGQFYKVGDDIKGEIFNDYDNNKAKGLYSHACGQNTCADQNNMFVCGQYNIYNENEPILNENKLFVVGNGSDDNNRNDAFVVYNTGKAYAKVFSTIGSDYAELFEVYDETIPIKDYEYKFITLKGDKAKIANHDDYILGVYSSQPAILGNSPINNFKNKYIPVGLIGKLIVYDYGKCNVDDFCKVGFNGCAIPYDKYIDNDISHYRVIKRYDENKIVIIFK